MSNHRASTSLRVAAALLAAVVVTMPACRSVPGSARPPTAGGSGGTGDAHVGAPGTTVVLCLIDGLMAAAARTAAANGATHIKFVLDNGVTVQRALSTSPASRLVLPDGTLPWGNATSGNVAVHTGTHLFESGAQGMDDIFKAARSAGIRSVFAGGDANYSAFVTADFHTAGALADDVVVQNAIDHLKTDQVRLIRLHLQRVRDDWSGLAGQTDPASPYIRHLVADDALLGRLIQALKDAGLWNQTFLVIAADHGMGQSAASDHPPSTASSWEPFMAFFGPGLKAAATIPYAELPDVAVTTMHFLGLGPLRGHTAPVDPAVPVALRGPTGVVLSNLFAGAPDDLAHPRRIERYLQSNTFSAGGDDYAPYRAAIMNQSP